jgi:hypothetical protein
MWGCSPDVGESSGERGPDKLTGVGMLEFELMEDVRSCLDGICTGTGGTCIVALLGADSVAMLLKYWVSGR